jgi:DNA-binding PadR family transcriptional regulator
MRGEFLGTFEELVLLAAHALGAEAYTASIQRKIEHDAHRAVSLGAVHAVLERLEQKGYVASRYGGATAQRGGRRKRFFQTTAAGARALRAAARAREAVSVPITPRPVPGRSQ